MNPKHSVQSAGRSVLLGLSAALFACAPSHEIITTCEDANDIHPICGFQNPEDLALLPDGHTVIVSQFGLMDGSKPGNLVIFDSANEATWMGFTGGTSAATPTPNWGDPECPGPPSAQFSPHGIDLARRPDGALQLLVVNHGGRESIEFFEVETGDQPALIWRGCAIPPPDSYLNDVVTLPDYGLLATHMMPRHSELVGMLRGGFGFDTGQVLEWRPAGGWRGVAGTEAPFPNGIEVSEDGRSIYLNAYMAGEVRRIDRETGALLARAKVPSPDNSAWGRDGRLWVASHRGDARDQMACYGLDSGTCPMAFDIVALDPETLEAEVLVSLEGPPMGAGTIALDLGDEMLIGSFASNRLIRVPNPR